jgi:hypothetical protein
MSSTFSNLKFELIGNGEQSGTWGTTTNSNIGTAIEQAIVGMATLDSGDFTANVCTLTLINLSPPVAQDARALCLNIASGAVSAAGTINVPAIQKPYIVINGSSFAVTVKVSGQTGVAVPAGTRTVVYNNGTDVGAQVNWLGSLTLGAALSIASGGTGTTSTTFVNLATNVTGTLPVANGGTGTATPGLVQGANITITGTWPNQTIAAASPGTGTVTSVAVSGGTTGLTTTGGPITSSGTITLTGTLAAANGGTGQTTLTGLPLPQPVITQNVQVISTNTTAVASRTYVLTASLTLTLPASPSAGDWVAFSNRSGTLTSVIARYGQNIMGLAENMTVDNVNYFGTLVFADATRGWIFQ